MRRRKGEHLPQQDPLKGWGLIFGTRELGTAIADKSVAQAKLKNRRLTSASCIQQAKCAASDEPGPPKPVCTDPSTRESGEISGWKAKMQVTEAQAACFALRPPAPPRSGLPINTRWSLVISTQPSLLMPNGREAHRDGDGRTAPLGHIASRWSGGPAFHPSPAKTGTVPVCHARPWPPAFKDPQTQPLVSPRGPQPKIF